MEPVEESGVVKPVPVSLTRDRSVLPHTAFRTTEIAAINRDSQPPLLPSEESSVEEIPLISNAFFETDIRQAIQDIASQAGVTIIVGPEVQGFITLDLQEVPLDQALQRIVAGLGLDVIQTEDYYLITSSDTKTPSFRQVSKLQLVKLSHAKAPNALKLLAPSFQDYVSADDETNTVSVTAPPQLLERIVSDLKTIDKRPKQILLEVRVVALESSDLLDLGVRWQWPTVAAGAFSSSLLHGGGSSPGGSWPWGVRIGFVPDTDFTQSLLLTLNLLYSNDQASILSNPQVMVKDGENAEINVTIEEYFIILAQDAFYARSELEKVRNRNGFDHHTTNWG